MDRQSIELGSHCGRHGSYTFYKSFKYKDNGRWRSVTTDHFFFVNVSKNSPLCIGEMQLIWTVKNNMNDPLSSVRLYFLPEQLPEGRQLYHGENEVIATEKIVLRMRDLITWIVDDVEWTLGGMLALLDIPCAKGLPPDTAPSPVVVLSYPKYCRLMAALRRLEGTAVTAAATTGEQAAEAGLAAAVVGAICGLAQGISASTKVLFCRSTFEHPDLEEHEYRCDHLAPNLKGRPRKKHSRQADDSDSTDEYAPSQSTSAEAAPTVAETTRAESEAKAQPRSSVDLATLGDIVKKENGSIFTSVDEAAFLKAVYKFMRERGTPIHRIPSLGFKQIDLFVLYRTAEKLGGYKQICQKRMWKLLYDQIGGNPSNTSAATCTRKHYEKLLLPFEDHMKKDLVTKESSVMGSDGENDPRMMSPDGSQEPTPAASGDWQRSRLQERLATQVRSSVVTAPSSAYAPVQATSYAAVQTGSSLPSAPRDGCEASALIAPPAPLPLNCTQRRDSVKESDMKWCAELGSVATRNSLRETPAEAPVLHRHQQHQGIHAADVLASRNGRDAVLSSAAVSARAKFVALAAAPTTPPLVDRHARWYSDSSAAATRAAVTATTWSVPRPNANHRLPRPSSLHSDFVAASSPKVHRAECKASSKSAVGLTRFSEPLPSPPTSCSSSLSQSQRMHNFVAAAASSPRGGDSRGETLNLSRAASSLVGKKVTLPVKAKCIPALSPPEAHQKQRESLSELIYGLVHSATPPTRSAAVLCPYRYDGRKVYEAPSCYKRKSCSAAATAISNGAPSEGVDGTLSMGSGVHDLTCKRIRLPVTPYAKSVLSTSPDLRPSGSSYSHARPADARFMSGEATVRQEAAARNEASVRQEAERHESTVRLEAAARREATVRHEAAARHEAMMRQEAAALHEVAAQPLQRVAMTRPPQQRVAAPSPLHSHHSPAPQTSHHGHGSAAPITRSETAAAQLSSPTSNDSHCGSRSLYAVAAPSPIPTSPIVQRTTVESRSNHQSSQHRSATSSVGSLSDSGSHGRLAPSSVSARPAFQFRLPGSTYVATSPTAHKQQQAGLTRGDSVDTVRMGAGASPAQYSRVLPPVTSTAVCLSSRPPPPYHLVGAAAPSSHALHAPASSTLSLGYTQVPPHPPSPQYMFR